PDLAACRARRLLPLKWASIPRLAASAPARNHNLATPHYTRCAHCPFFARFSGLHIVSPGVYPRAQATACSSLHHPTQARAVTCVLLPPGPYREIVAWLSP